MGRIGVHQIRLARHRGVHVTVEDQAQAAARAGQCSQYVEAVAQQSDLAGAESLLPHPGVEVLADLAFVAHRAVDVADLERKPNELVSVDQRNDVVANGHAEFP
jgi:hypothetical protein